MGAGPPAGDSIPATQNSHRPRRLAALALLGLLVAQAGACRRHSYEEREVNFEKRIPPAKVGLSTDLNFALAAMISPKETNRHYEKLIVQLAKKIGQPIKLSHGRSYEQVNTLLRAGKLDMALICTGGYMELAATPPGAPILAVPQVRGKATYRSLVIVRQESTARTFADLKGKRFAFTDPLSNTGCLYPLSEVQRLGSTKEQFFSSHTFVGSHDRAIRAVQRGVQDAAAVDSLVFEYFNMRRPDAVKGLRILQRSPEYGIPPVVAAPQTTALQRKKWRHALMSLHTDPAAARTLKLLEIERFVVPADGLYDGARTLWQKTR